MKILIDSHILIWLLYNSSKLPPDTKAVLQQADTVFISQVSLWELAIKYAKGKLPYSPAELMQGADKSGLTRLPIRDKHIRALPGTSLPHNDPFDTMLIAQNNAEGCVFMTADTHILRSKHKSIDASGC